MEQAGTLPHGAGVDVAYDAALVSVEPAVELVVSETGRYAIRGGVFFVGGLLGRYVLVDRSGAAEPIRGLLPQQTAEYKAALGRLGKALSDVVLFCVNGRVVGVGRGYWALVSGRTASEEPRLVSSLLCPPEWGDMYEIYGVLTVVGTLQATLSETRPYRAVDADEGFFALD